MKNIEEFSGKKSGKNGPAGRKKDRMSNRAWQKNKGGDSKEESNDSPEIPDWGETSDISGHKHAFMLMRLHMDD